MTSKIFEENHIKIVNCDMFSEDGLYSIADSSINAIITDFPYGTLNKRNKWDKVINYDIFWNEAKRIGFDTTPTITNYNKKIP